MPTLRPFLLLAALVIALTVAPAAHAAPLFGFNDTLASWGQVDAIETMGLAKSAGATSSRIGVDWRSAEPTKGGALQLSAVDAAYSAAASRSIKPVLTVFFA